MSSCGSGLCNQLILAGPPQERLAWVNDTMKLYRCHGDQVASSIFGRVFCLELHGVLTTVASRDTSELQYPSFQILSPTCQSGSALKFQVPNPHKAQPKARTKAAAPRTHFCSGSRFAHAMPSSQFVVVPQNVSKRNCYFESSTSHNSRPTRESHHKTRYKQHTNNPHHIKQRRIATLDVLGWRG